MQPLIIKSIRLIAAQMISPPSDDFLFADALSEASVGHPPQPYVLDSSIAESVAGGSLIFPDPKAGSEPDWCVLALYSTDTIRKSRTFRFVARLPAIASAAEFAQLAYDHILCRTIDDEGRKLYSSLLESAGLTRRDLLKIIAGCPEARARKNTVLIIPQPSSWLAGLAVMPGSDTRWPPFIVKAGG